MKISALKLAFGGAAIWSLMLIAVSERDPRPPQVAADPVTDRWISETEPARKADRLPLPQVAAVDPAPVAVPVVEPALPPAPLPVPRPARTERRTHQADICTRHGMRRVATHGGKSWRCRRGA